MYELNEIKYRFSLTDGDYYTGFVIEEDEHCILINTIKDEKVVVGKSNIAKAKKLKENGKF